MVFPWNKVPAAAVKNIGPVFKRSDFGNWWFWYGWHYGWSGREYGLHWNDQVFEPNPEVREALRRLCLKDPFQFDQRKVRLHRATLLSMNNEILPKEQWTQWDEETFYLEPILDEIEQEKMERVKSSGIKPAYKLKDFGNW